MKSKIKVTLVLTAVILILGGCSTISNNKSSTKAENLPMYEEGGGRDDMTMAILRPTGQGLSSDEEKYLGIIQGALYNDVGKFSAIKLFDSMNNKEILEQQRLSLSGNYSEKDYIKIGELANSRYVMAGTLTKTGTTYTLNLSVTDVETGISQANFNKANIKLREITNSTASRAAVANILPQLKVNLTDAGREALGKEISADELEAQNALALSYEASMSGNLIDALIYSYTASNTDKSSQAAKNQAANAFKMMGGTGTAIKEDIKQQSYWKNNLIAFEQFYKNHPPFELYYTSVPVKKGDIDYDTGIVNYEFTVGMRHKNVKTMENVLNDILRQLSKTNSKKNHWGFDNWPTISAESTKANQIINDTFKGYSTYNITASLYNNEDEPIGTIDFVMYGQLILVSNNRIKAVSTQERKLIITTQGNLLTDDMQIRIDSINNINADLSNANNFIRNTNVGKMPLKSLATISKEQILVPLLPEEIEKHNKEVAKKADKRNKEVTKKREKENYWNSKPLEKRSNINIVALYNLQESDSEKALSVEGGLGFGYRNFSLDFKAILPISPVQEKIKNKEGELVYGFGFATGYSFVWKYAILGIEGGLTYFIDDNLKSSSLLPTLEAKIDLIPGQKGFALRFGYKLEFGDPEDNDFNRWYFNSERSSGSNSLRIIGSPMVGIVIY
ncbi:hypothetical protein [Treponema sp. R80B11-R83G3]